MRGRETEKEREKERDEEKESKGERRREDRLGGGGWTEKTRDQTA